MFWSKTKQWDGGSSHTNGNAPAANGAFKGIQTVGNSPAQPVFGEPRSSAAKDRQRALRAHLMEQVCETENLNRAYARVKANKGSPGVDGMSVNQLGAWIKLHKHELIASLLDGGYHPQPVRGVQIPKPGGGGMRQLGIPTVIDRLVQQAIGQVLEPILDPFFSASSYGFRPGCSAHDALRKAKQYVAEGRVIVVDIDLEKFFDKVNHDILMARLGRWVGDKRMLRIIGRFLRAGMMQNGVCMSREEGTPQGGPLSPLLANLLLDDLDKELEKRGHKFCRYADDCNIYVQSQAAGKRVLSSVTTFLEQKLKLRVNREKSAVAFVAERKFLGHRLLSGGRLGIAPQSIERAKERLRQITRRNRGVSFEQVIGEINQFVVGWVTFFRHAACKRHLVAMDQWLRHRLRCLRLKQCKAHQNHCRLPATAGRAQAARLDRGIEWQRLVAHCRHSSGPRRDECGMVRIS
ncbi:MAG: group II intron reverse transcriptase/maturase [Planctomycetota bacterium]|nr:group II intron reverse transcriptase/maturase [Planctomycetota bacterium]